jgi:hypothetical protein
MLERWLKAQAGLSRVHGVPAEANGHDPGLAAFAGELARGEVPTIRRIRAELHVGQPRAPAIQTRLSALASTP